MTNSTKAKHLVFNLLRLTLSVLCFAASLLAVFEAPTNSLWIIAILVTEYGHFFAPLPLLVLLPGWQRSRLGWISVALGLIAAALATTPFIRALPVASNLPKQFDSVFGADNHSDSEHPIGKQKPLVFSDLVFCVSIPQIESRTIAYDDKDGKMLTLDLYRPAETSTPNPAIIVIHGGAWQSGDSKQLPKLNRYLAAHGYVVAAITYRLAPRWRFPAAVEDVQTAIDYLKNHAVEFGLDPQQLVLLGRSAGAHLALLVAYTANDAAIRGVVSFYGPADLHFGYTYPANPMVIDSRQVLEDFLGGSPDELPEIYEASSPIQFIGPSTPPTLLIHGGRDELVSPEQSRRLAAKLNQSNVPHVFLYLPWATHGCDHNFSGPSGQMTTYAIEHFLSAIL